MALRLYHDLSGTQEITNSNRDSASGPVTSGNMFTHEKRIFIKSDDVSLTYRNISIEGHGDDAQVDVKYAVDNAGKPGTYQDILTLSNGAYITSIAIWRKVTAPSVTQAINRTNINHRLKSHEYKV